MALYLDIERIRFSDRMKISVDIDPDCWPALVPSLLLQPLLENAVKFGVARNTGGATIELHAARNGDWLLLSVADDGPGDARMGEDAVGGGGEVLRNGVGLSNTRDRLRALYNDRQAVRVSNRSPRGFAIELQIPFDPASVEAR